MQTSLFISTLVSMTFLTVLNVSSAEAKTTFSSRYFDTSADCKCLEGDLSEGQDCTQFKCKEMEGYQIQMSYNGSACDLGELKVTKGSKEFISIKEVPAKLEWRFADNQVFAVIYRLKGPSKTCLEQSGSSKAAPKNVLVVSGLENYSALSGQINAKESNANTKARQLADKGFSDKLRQK